MSPNKEDYLKCIYELGQQYDKVTNKLIAQMMGVSAPAVSEMIKKILQEHYLEKHPKLGYRLSDSGMLLVSSLIRKHRLIEVFLQTKLNYQASDIHKEAEILEHAVSDLFIDRLDAYLGHPRTCPHGGMIPRKNEIIVEKTITLTHVLEGKSYKIRRIIEDQRLASYLEDLQLNLGDCVSVLANNDFAQVITLEKEGRKITLSQVIAEQIFVELL